MSALCLCHITTNTNLCMLSQYGFVAVTTSHYVMHWKLLPQQVVRIVKVLNETDQL